MMSRSPFVSIIIVNYNGRYLLHDCLSSVFAIDYPAEKFEVIVVDNDSRDDSVSYIKRYFPQVNLVALKENTGFTGGNIAGLQQAKGEYIVLLNTDAAVDKSWLKCLVKAAGPDTVGLVAPKIFYATPFIELEITTPVVPFSDISHTTDFKPIGTMIEDVLCQTDEKTCQVWYKSGFYEQTFGAISTRWTRGKATILVPFSDPKEESFTFTFHGHPTVDARSTPVAVHLGHKELLSTTVHANEVKQCVISVKRPKARSHFTWLIQNAGNVVFQTGYGRDRGSVVRQNSQRESSEFYEEDNEYFDTPTQLLSICGASCLIKREVINQIGFFDPHYFMYYEDLDLSLRAWKAGWDIVYEPTAIVHHIHKATTNKTDSSFFLSMVEQNHLVFTLTHFPLSTFVHELFLFGLRLGMTILKSLVFRFRDNLERSRNWNARADGRIRAAKNFTKSFPRVISSRFALKQLEIRSYKDMRKLLY